MTCHIKDISACRLHEFMPLISIAPHSTAGGARSAGPPVLVQELEQEREQECRGTMHGTWIR